MAKKKVDVFFYNEYWVNHCMGKRNIKNGKNNTNKKMHNVHKDALHTQPPPTPTKKKNSYIRPGVGNYLA